MNDVMRANQEQIVCGAMGFSPLGSRLITTPRALDIFTTFAWVIFALALVAQCCDVDLKLGLKNSP